MDFADCAELFAGPVFEFSDNRGQYGEDRRICIGFLDGRMIVIVYVDRYDERRIISMRKANEREIRRYREKLGRP